MRIEPLAADDVERVDAVLPLSRLLPRDGLYLVAWDDDEPIGHAHLALTDPPEIQDVWVAPQRRRTGVAAALTRAAELEAAARGAAVVRLTVGIANDAARRLYAKLGYGECGIPPRRVQGTITIRGEPVEVDDTLLTLEKPVP